MRFFLNIFGNLKNYKIHPNQNSHGFIPKIDYFSIIGPNILIFAFSLSENLIRSKYSLEIDPQEITVAHLLVFHLKYAIFNTVFMHVLNFCRDQNLKHLKLFLFEHVFEFKIKKLLNKELWKYSWVLCFSSIYCFVLPLLFCIISVISSLYLFIFPIPETSCFLLEAK